MISSFIRVFEAKSALVLNNLEQLGKILRGEKLYGDLRCKYTY